MEQVENRLSGMEDKVEDVYQTVKHHERMLGKYKWTMQDNLGHQEKTNLQTLV
jgi:hypothetical protein